jgi:hypothetical protein
MESATQPSLVSHPFGRPPAGISGPTGVTVIQGCESICSAYCIGFASEFPFSEGDKNTFTVTLPLLESKLKKSYSLVIHEKFSHRNIDRYAMEYSHRRSGSSSKCGVSEGKRGNSRNGLSKSRKFAPGGSLYGSLPRGMSCFDRNHSGSLDEAYGTDQLR